MTRIICKCVAKAATLFLILLHLFQKLEFAKSKSDATAKRDGSWKQKEALKRKAEKGDDKAAKKAARADDALEAVSAPGGSIAMEEEVTSFPQSVPNNHDIYAA